MFDSSLYRLLAEKPGNLFFSPYSIAAALSMVHAGAGGATKSELETTLGHPDPVGRHGALARELRKRSEPTEAQKNQMKWMPEVPADSYGCHLTVANAMWRQKGYPVAAGFVETLKTTLGAEVGEADFQGAPAEAVRALNAWAAKATRDKIRDILQERQLHPQTRVVLANAIYFKARWENEFSDHATRPSPFRLLDGRKVDVATMHNTGHLPSVRDGAVHALSLAYLGGALVMLLLLPDEGKLAQVERELDDARLEKLTASMKTEQTQLALPKFKVESSFMLAEPLRKLGLRTAFTPEADFSRISAEPGFALSEVLHKTFVDVNEKGTEAAAVTMPMAAGSAPPRKVVEFKVDRPFLFVIRDLPTKTTLFMGRVVDPRG